MKYGERATARSGRYFPPFALDGVNECLWRGEAAIRVSPKAYAVLNHLVERAGLLVRKQELLDAVWPEGFVGDGVVKVCVLEVRRALGDSAKTPRFIETLRGRGYRFVVQVFDHPAAAAGAPAGGSALFGRDHERERLRASLDRALAGTRQVVFVSGEAGTGKTALVEEFLLSVGGRSGLEVTRGQCLVGQVREELYYPILEALGRLGSGPQSVRVVEILLRHAPPGSRSCPR